MYVTEHQLVPGVMKLVNALGEINVSAKREPKVALFLGYR